jgi:hypothetical protein
LNHSLPAKPNTRLPKWVPLSAKHYLAHTESGLSIRALARTTGCHASTVLRQIRKVESMRDDPLIDAALRTLGTAHFSTQRSPPDIAATQKEPASMTLHDRTKETAPNEATMAHEALRILRRLCETGAVLAVASEMEKAVVVRDGADGASVRTAVVETTVAQAMALKDWIACKSPGRISKYHITPSGRAALSRLLAEHENQVRRAKENGFAEDQSAFGDQRAWDGKEIDAENEDRVRKIRYNLAESPLTGLSRRRDKDGAPFLSEDLVTAGERLREDFELAQMGPRVAQNWERFLTGGARGNFAAQAGGAPGPAAARDRVAKALSDLGPGLSDVVLRCCCFLEGLETAEKRMGWSARSGKIVLRIALQRLKRHYEDAHGPFGPLIG